MEVGSYEKAFHPHYKEDIGRFAGMRFLFSGSGMVDDVRVKDGEGRAVFEDVF